MVLHQLSACLQTKLKVVHSLGIGSPIFLLEKPDRKLAISVYVLTSDTSNIPVPILRHAMYGRKYMR